MSTAIDVELDPRLLGDDDQAFTEAVVPAMVLYRYLRAELSLGEVAELLHLDHAGVLQWLNELGVPTIRERPADIAQAERQNGDALLAELRAERR